MKVVIIKYNDGNIQSVKIALQRLKIDPLITDDRELISDADHIIFPGVGEASSAMAFLKKKELDLLLQNLDKPLLGICLGLQLLCKRSEENNTRCLGIFDTSVHRFPDQLKVPHMGWNTINNLKGPLFKNISDGSYMYFVHSYYAEIHEQTIAVTDYMLPFSSALQHDYYFSVQFHPEKSGEVGEKILKNFLMI